MPDIRRDGVARYPASWDNEWVHVQEQPLDDHYLRRLESGEVGGLAIGHVPAEAKRFDLGAAQKALALVAEAETAKSERSRDRFFIYPYRLRRRREELDLSLSELGRRIGRSPAFMSRVERAEVGMSGKDITALAKELGVEWRWLLWR